MSGPRFLLLAAALLATAARPDPVAAQDTTRLSAAMLKRLGEAVDGYRTGYPYWVTMSLVFPHRVLGVFPSPDSAVAAAQRGGREYGVFGPYYAAVDPGNEDLMFAAGFCPGRHRWDSECPDEIAMEPLGGVPLRDVASLTVILRTKDGREIRTTYAPHQVDALFFTLAAIDKFAIPYYERLYGVAYAARLREEYVRRLGRR
ncbi:MAG: hypothetical protein ACREL9_12575 [Gemmatimonadales bacterium]